jgi:MerR family transcriptional regulator, redox-sensitive transcriptional activator SoxR
MQNFGIGEIADRAGIAASAIRYYEQIGLLPSARRVSGKRRYDLSILQKLRMIRLAKQTGLTIEEIQVLLHDFPENTPPSIRWAALAQGKIAELDEKMLQIQQMKSMLEKALECECLTLEDCVLDEMS